MTVPGLAFKNLSRNTFRVVLTILGVAVAVITFVVLRTILWAWSLGGEAAAKDRVVTRNKVTFVMPLPKHYYDEVLENPHVQAATFANWFGGKDPKHDREFFAALAGDTKTFFNVYPEMSLSRDQLDAWLQDRRGAVVGDVLAK